MHSTEQSRAIQRRRRRETAYLWSHHTYGHTHTLRHKELRLWGRKPPSVAKTVFRPGDGEERYERTRQAPFYFGDSHRRKNSQPTFLVEGWMRYCATTTTADWGERKNTTAHNTTCTLPRYSTRVSTPLSDHIRTDQCFGLAHQHKFFFFTAEVQEIWRRKEWTRAREPQSQHEVQRHRNKRTPTSMNHPSQNETRRRARKPLQIVKCHGTARVREKEKNSPPDKPRHSENDRTSTNILGVRFPHVMAFRILTLVLSNTRIAKRKGRKKEKETERKADSHGTVRVYKLSRMVCCRSWSIVPLSKRAAR